MKYVICYKINNEYDGFVWNVVFFPSLDDAKNYAQKVCLDVGTEVFVSEFLGSFLPVAVYRLLEERNNG